MYGYGLSCEKNATDRTSDARKYAMLLPLSSFPRSFSFLPLPLSSFPPFLPPVDRDRSSSDRSRLWPLDGSSPRSFLRWIEIDLPPTDLDFGTSMDLPPVSCKFSFLEVMAQNIIGLQYYVKKK